jgi:transcriptional regulator with XRE-family HTH domain
MVNGLKIKSYIKKSKITQQDFSKSVGVSVPTISKVINNNACDLQTLIQIADVMNVSLDYLCDRLEDSEQSVRVNGNKNQVGNGNVIIESQATEIEHLKQLLEEKERTIQILINK